MCESRFNSQYPHFNDDLKACASSLRNQKYTKYPQISDTVKTTPAPLWSIEDSFFYPLGLVHHAISSANKSLFVTWCEDYLLSFLFKIQQETNQIKLSKVRRIEVDNDEQILEILILELNLLLLMNSGNVYYLSTVKQMEVIPWLTGVRALSAATSHSFSVIRVQHDNRLNLAVYCDVVDLGKSEPKLLQQFDITYDELNIFNCQWQDERFTLHTQMVLEENSRFLEYMFGKKCDFSKVRELHFFTVSGNLYALIADSSLTSEITTDFNICLLATYASAVEFIRIISAHQLCLIFLACGTIDIWFVSDISKCLQRQAHHTGVQYVNYEFSEENGCFYYTDGDRIAQLKFKYITNTDSCQVLESFKSIPGIVACTWDDNKQQLVCLSCNNIFYYIKFDDEVVVAEQTKTTVTEDASELYDLTPDTMHMLLKKARNLNELSTVSAQLHEAIKSENMKQQLLAVASKKRIYERHLKAHLEFATQIPANFPRDTVLLYTRTNFIVDSNSYYAFLHLNFPKNDVFQATLWNLHISYNETAHMLIVPRELLHQKLCVILPFINKNTISLPKFKLNLVAFIRNENDFIAVILKISVVITATTYAKLFNSNTTAITLCCDYNLNDLISKFSIEANTLSNSTTTVITYTLMLPKSVNFQKILNICNVTDHVLDESDAFDLYFSAVKIHITYIVAQNCVKLESTDVLGLFYIKMLLFHSFKEMDIEAITHVAAGDGVDVQQMILQFQCDVERGYGKLLNSVDDYVNSASLYLPHLKCIYTKLRNDPFNIRC